MAYLDKVRINNTDYQLVGTGEMLPIGTELDIDSNADIPAGWEEVSVENYEILNLATTTSGEHYYTIRRIGQIVSFIASAVWVETITSDTWITVGQVPASIIPDRVALCVVNLSDPAQGVSVGYGKLMVTVEGDIKLKTAINRSTPTGIEGNITWILPDTLTTKRIKKVTQTTPASLEEMYDGEERVIGTYFGKPLYRKVIELTVQEYEALDINTENRKLYPLNFDIDNCVRGDTITTYQDSNNKPLTKVYPMHNIGTNSYESGIHNIWDNNIVFYVGSSITSNLLHNIYLILEYTKTTD